MKDGRKDHQKLKNNWSRYVKEFSRYKHNLRTMPICQKLINERRTKLLNEISLSEQSRQQAADKLAEAEKRLNETNSSLREVQIQLTKIKEERARIEPVWKQFGKNGLNRLESLEKP